MRTLFKYCLAFLPGLALLGNVAAIPTITDAPTMGREGSHTFAATSSTGTTIKWKVAKIQRSDTGDETIVNDSFATATGPTATFSLPKDLTVQTLYRVRATDNPGDYAFHKIQVFTPNDVEYFTYKPPHVNHPLMKVFIVVPTTVSADKEMLVAMHGAGRGGRGYCGLWTTWANGNNTIVICPQFTKEAWPDPHYNTGSVFNTTGIGTVRDPFVFTTLKDESEWAFTVVEQAQKYVRLAFSLEKAKFDMWGHSAGGQFTHRFRLFKPDAKVRKYMIAVPGWYTLPSLNTAYPCGLQHRDLSFDATKVENYSALNAHLFLGTEDTDPDGPETGGCMDSQGAGRYARGRNFYNFLQSLTGGTAWTCHDVEGAGHTPVNYATVAQQFLDGEPIENVCNASLSGSRKKR